MPDHCEVRIDAGGVHLDGTLTMPASPRGVVAFAHGSGSSRLSSRNQAVAAALWDAGLATLLFDLLTVTEAVDRANVFDIPLLAERLTAAGAFLRNATATTSLPIGYFGASTGAAAALLAASGDHQIAAVVSRGGRPDLAGERLPDVTAPTLLIIGSLDYGVIELNEQAYAQLRCEKRLEIVPGASHLFEEPGTLEQVADLARVWFIQHLRPTVPVAGRPRS